MELQNYVRYELRIVSRAESPVPSSSFDGLIQGLSREEFFTQCFEKQPVLFRTTRDPATETTKGKRKRGGEHNEQLFSRSKLVDIVQHQGLPQINNMTITRYVGGKREDKVFTDEMRPVTKKVLDEAFDKGKYTIQFYQPQRFVDELYLINASFEEIFGTLAGASAYLTPPNSQGLEPHHDDVEVFVLQTEGSKKWRLYLDKSESLPDYYAKNLPADRLKSPVEVTLHQGDLLYLPRGAIHEAVTTDSFSTHITISVYQHYNNKTLFKALLPKLADSLFHQSVDFRRGLPPRMQNFLGTFAPAAASSLDKRRVMLEQMQHFLKEIADHASDPKTKAEKLLDEAADEVQADFVENRLPPPNDPVGRSSDGFNGACMIEAESMHMQVEKGSDGLDELVLYQSFGNDRRRHMGHPLWSEDEDEGEEEEEEEEEEDEQLIGKHAVKFPIRLAPLITAIRSSLSIDEKALCATVAPLGIRGKEVVRVLQLLSQQKFLR
jgi:lysine-specific demethylase/histidyl-hydroxylase NO66